MAETKDVIRKTDADAIRLAKTLLRTARYGAIAVIDPSTSAPLASRVGVATDLDGVPLILVSGLSAHTAGLLGEPRCSLLVGETGKGDPLAHPRMSIACRARRLERETPEHERAERRYLNRNPKAALYAGLGDFSIFRLEPQGASLNGGFGKAYALERSDLLVEGPVTEALAANEQGALDHMNADHRDAIQAYAHHYAKARSDSWVLAGIDVEGMDLLTGDEARRVFFPQPLAAAQDLRKVLVEMARAARDAGAAVAGHEGNDHMGA